MKNTITLFIFALLLSSCAKKTKYSEKNKYSIDNYSDLVGLYSAQVEDIIGKPDVVDDDGWEKVYTYKQISLTNLGNKCDLFLYFDGVRPGRFTNDIVGTIKTSSCEDTSSSTSSSDIEFDRVIDPGTTSTKTISIAKSISNKGSNRSTSSNNNASSEEWKRLNRQKRVYNLGYNDGQMAYGLPASQRANAFEVHMAKGYNFSNADYNLYVTGYKDGQFARKRKY